MKVIGELTEAALDPTGQVLVLTGTNTNGQPHVQHVPLTAIAAWGELLGLSDEEALAAIISEVEPEPDPSDPTDNGWSSLYGEVMETQATEVFVEAAVIAEQVKKSDGLAATVARERGRVPLVPPVVEETVRVYGPELVQAQTEALQEDRQRAARARIPIDTNRLPQTARAAVTGTLAAHLAQCRADFLDTYRPAIPLGFAEEAV